MLMAKESLMISQAAWSPLPTLYLHGFTKSALTTHIHISLQTLQSTTPQL